MALNHGINTYKASTDFAGVKAAGVGIPFFIGCWPAHQGDGFTGKPQLATCFEEAKKLGGYSTDWRDNNGAPKWSLCQAMYAFFKLFGMQPAVFYNVYNPSTHKIAVSAADIDVTDHVVKLVGDAINDATLVVKTTDATPVTLVKDTDYEVSYEDNNLVISLIYGSTHYSASELNVAYNKADLSAITATTIESAVEKIEECKAAFGIVPDLICAPGWSKTPSVAAVMAAKAPNINGLFKGKAVVDIDTAAAAADTYDDVLNWKNTNGYTDENMIVCWPLAKSGDYIFDMSVIACGQMAKVDTGNGDCPYESPSNKGLSITGLCNAAGTEINLSINQADVLSYSAGVVTALNFNGWVLWGNYTGCWPSSTDVSDYFICTNRMMDFICNTFVNSYWGCLDRPLTRVLIDSIVNSFNSWLAGLTHEGKLYGGEIKYVPGNNPVTNLIAGIFRLDVKQASPVPAQEIDMYVTYDVDILNAALNS